MIKINSYTAAGTKTSVAFPKVLEEKVNLDLLAQAVRVYQDRSHPGLSKVKTRGEMTLTTAKVWRQKGTGRARHGARSAPIFVGGGVAHGPKGIKRTLKMSKKMAKKALLVALSLKAKEGKVIVVNNLSKIAKTKDAQKLVNTLAVKENLNKDSLLSVIIGKEDVQAKRAFRNLKNVRILNSENLNTLDVFQGGLLIFENNAFDAFGKTGKSVSKNADKKSSNTEKTEGIEKRNTKKISRTKSRKGIK